MVRNKIVLKTIALLLVIEMLVNILTPTVSWALTAGPSAPEFSSFEPVDTTDMVNLATGDFNYNIPLLEVPGPSGGYPLSLAYHAAILPDEEASWVGLGWSLSPGSIGRMVNGYPDDQLGAMRTRVDHNSGGTTETFTAGVGYAGASFNLSIADDSNQGLGLGFSAGGQMQMGDVSLGISAGKKPHTSATYGRVGLSYKHFTAGLYIDEAGAEPTVGLTSS